MEVRYTRIIAPLLTLGLALATACDRGAHPVQIQMLLGHATLGNLSQYLRVTITDMQKAYDQSNPAK